MAAAAKDKNGGGSGKGNAGKGARFVQLSQLYSAGAYALPAADRRRILEGLSRPVSEAKPGDLGKPEPITWWEEALAVLFLFVFLGAMFWVPLVVVLFVVFVRDPWAWAVFVVVGLVLSTHPIPRMEWAVHGRLNRILFKYFSLRMVYEEELDGQYIFVAPPHGVLPFGNLLTVHAMRNINGIDFLGLTTDAALKLPFFRHYLAAIGTVSASRNVAQSYLDRGWSIGISSGGVAEIFKANADGHEVILLRERKGFVKLALRTGVQAIVPCFIYGNTQIMSLWYDRWGILESISRKMQCGVLPIWGRWGLPIFFRKPILGVVGKPIYVPQVEGEPSQELIDKYHALFIDELQALFNRYSAFYGEKRELLIK